MMREELGLVEDEKKPLTSSVSTFVGFNIIGIIPLLPFLIFIGLDFPTNHDAFVYSVVSTIIAFFLVGMIKGRIVKKSKIRSGIFTLMIGGIAAGVAYVVGYSIKILVL